MKREYDFSKGEQGKFFGPGAKIKLPVGVAGNIELADVAAERLAEFLNLGLSGAAPRGFRTTPKP